VFPLRSTAVQSRKFLQSTEYRYHGRKFPTVVLAQTLRMAVWFLNFLPDLVSARVVPYLSSTGRKFPTVQYVPQSAVDRLLNPLYRLQPESHSKHEGNFGWHIWLENDPAPANCRGWLDRLRGLELDLQYLLGR
jgi:hypothetical protein